MAMKHVSDFLVVKAQHEWNQNRSGPWSHELLAQWTGQSEMVCFRCLKRAVNNGFLEYDTTVRASWLTEEGRALLGLK